MTQHCRISLSSDLEVEHLPITMMISPDGSPISTPSSGSPSPEETGVSYNQTGSTTSTLLNFVTSSLSPGSSKRRMPAASHFSSASNRDSKSRRREDSRRGMGGGGGAWESKDLAGKRDKEELVDNQIVDYFRKEIGDPFYEN
ncbi:hypothetical protein C8J56DRAFT_978656 [Mycena floridula]|nr:hypothetical protein C8J56DRAFT_978656 [Mycena floridula]